MTSEQIKNYHSVLPDPDEKDRYCIRIERGPFAGLVVAYGRFQMAEEEHEDGTTGVRFEYDFIDIPPEMVGVDFEDEEGEELEQILGQIYIHFLNMELEHRKEESEDGTTRRYDFQKPFV
tara:strand:+ start:314 stop:673 length:360 start_codon:yes stop_codon:yes gene_type:complete